MDPLARAPHERQSIATPTWDQWLTKLVAKVNDPNAATATALQTARTINGVAFNGTSNITVPAAASTLTGSAAAWTPADASGAGLAFTQIQPYRAAVIGPLVVFSAFLQYPATASGLTAKISGLPVACGVSPGGALVTFTTSGLALVGYVRESAAQIEWFVGSTAVTNVQLTGAFLGFIGAYLQ